MPATLLSDEQVGFGKQPSTNLLSDKDVGFTEPSTPLDAIKPPPGFSSWQQYQQATQEYDESMKSGEFTAAATRGIPRAIGEAAQYAGKVIKAVPADVGIILAGNLPENTLAAFRGQPLPVEREIKILPPWEQAIYSGAAGTLESVPRLAASAALPESTPLVWGSTPEGFDPKQALLATALPVIGRYSGAIAESIASRLGVSSDTALNILNRAGGATSAASLIGADQAAQIMQLPPEQRKDALIDAIGNTASMAVLGGLGGRMAKGISKLKPQPKETYAQTIRGDTGQLPEPGRVSAGSQATSGYDVEQAPPGQPEPVAERKETPLPAPQLPEAQAETARPVKPEDLQTALIVNGKPLVGGYSHGDIVANAPEELQVPAAEAFENEANKVFIDKRTGKIYTRAQAGEALGGKGWLDSGDLPKPKTTEPIVSRFFETPVAETPTAVAGATPTPPAAAAVKPTQVRMNPVDAHEFANWCRGKTVRELRQLRDDHEDDPSSKSDHAIEIINEVIAEKSKSGKLTFIPAEEIKSTPSAPAEPTPPKKAGMAAAPTIKNPLKTSWGKSYYINSQGEWRQKGKPSEKVNVSTVAALEQLTGTKPEMVGMGGAEPKEFEPSRQTPTGIKNAKVDEERQLRGLSPIMKTERLANPVVWDAAMARIDADPGWQDSLIDELREHPRTTTPEETIALDHRYVDLLNDHAKMTRDLAQAYEDAKEFPNRQEQVDELNVRLAGLSDKLMDFEMIVRKVGTEWGRSGQIRQRLLKEDYSLAEMEMRKRAANGGRPLTDAERVELQKAHEQIAGLQQKYDELLAKKSEQQTVPVVDSILNETKRSTPKGSSSELAGLDKTKEKIGASLKKSDQPSINGLVQKLIRAFVEENPAITRDQLVDQVHDVLKEFMPDIERRETMDAISGYGDYKPLKKDTISVIVRDLKGQLQQIGKLEDMAAGEAPRKTGLERRTPSDEERRLIKQVEEAKRRGGYKVTDPAAQLRTALQTIKTRLENQIKDLEFQLANRQKIVRVKTPVQLDATAEALKVRRDELKAQFDEMFPREPISDAQRLANWKKRTQTRINELQEKLAAGDFSKRPIRPPPELDSEAQRLQAELFRAKQNFQRGLIEDRLKARPWWVKAQDTFLRWYRGGILSSPVVFAKLTAAAVVRSGLTPMEEAVGAGIGKVFPKLAARAPREGYWNSNAEAKAIMAQLTKGPKDAWDVLRTGETDIDILYGKGREGAIGEMQVRPFSIADIPGRTHAAFKSSTKRAEFERSLEKRLAFEIRNGVDASSPAVQLKCAVEAYKDANRSIFLQDNRVVSAWQSAINRLEQPDKLTGKPTWGGKALATTGKTLLPIVKVPSNIVAEAFQFATGSVTGSARLVKAASSGIDTLPPEQADLIMRELKKGTIGGAALLVGFLLPQVWGGFYQRGERRKPGQIPAESARIGGVDVPQSLMHHPVFETIQAGATARKIADKNRKEGDLRIPIGVEAAALGLIEDAPFAREMVATGEAFGTMGERTAFFSELAKSITEPQLIQWLAKERDKDITGQPTTRAPKTFAQHLEMGIPYLRQNVPVKKGWPGAANSTDAGTGKNYYDVTPFLSPLNRP